MAKAGTINAITAKKLVTDLERIEQLKMQILRHLPDGVLPYGSELWWQREILTGEEEIKKGKYKTYDNAKDLIADLHKGI